MGDKANADGGKWVLTMKNNPLLDQCWHWLTMLLISEELDESDEICSAIASLCSKVDRIQLWTCSKDDLEKVNSIVTISDLAIFNFLLRYNMASEVSPTWLTPVYLLFVQVEVT